MRKIDQFVTLSIISRAGNACADFAFVWLGISLFKSTHSLFASTLNNTYIGQALGVILLAPVLSVLFDLSNKRSFALTLDLLYAMTLGVAIALNSFSLLTPLAVLLISILSAAMGTIHTSSVTMFALNTLGDGMTTSELGSRFSIALAASYLVGTIISGLVFSLWGLNACLTIGIISFIPMLCFYLLSFPKSNDLPRTKIPSLQQAISEPFKALLFIKEKKELFRFIILLAFLNTTAAIMPAIVSLYLNQIFPGETYIFSIVIASGILISILLTPQISKFVTRLRLKLIIPMNYITMTAVLIYTFLNPSLIHLVIMFTFICITSTAVNVRSGALRLRQIPQFLTGKANTMIAIFLYTGQLLGGLVLLPLWSSSPQSAIYLITGIYITASILSLLLL